MNFSKKNHELLNKKEDSVKKQQKQHQFSKLQKTSTIFTQLGLVLALFIVFLALELTTEKKSMVIVRPPTNVDESTVCIGVPPIIKYKNKEKQKVVEKEKAKKEVVLTEIVTTPDNSDIFDILDDDNPTNTIDSIIEVIPVIDKDITLPFTIIENAPIYPGCEGLDKKQSKKCFTQKISKFVNKRFDTSLAENHNITGRQRIFVEFVIDKTGKITDIRARSPHKRLEKEAIRVVKKLPKMTPGKQRTRPVSVKYTLPIVFEVY